MSLLMGICLSLATVSASPVFLPLSRFTLAWTHSIERVRWEEDYEVIKHHGQWMLVGVESRIKGSAAGMEPPTNARWRDGWFVYRPSAPPVPTLNLSRSEFTPDYELCSPTGCAPMSSYLASDGGTTLVQACTGSDRNAPLRHAPASGSSG